MTTEVLTLPTHLCANVKHASAETVVLDASACRTATLGALSALVRGLMSRRTQRVIVVNAGDTLRRQLETVHRARATPERSFLMTFRDVASDELLRAV